MSTRRSDDAAGRVLSEVLDSEAQSRAPDRLLEEVFARTTATRQARRRPWDGSRRRTAVGPLRWLVVAALFVVGGTAVFLGTGAGRPPTQLVPTTPPAAGPVGVAVADVCASGRGLAGTATTLWVGCPTGIRRVDTTTDPPTIGPLIEGIGRPVDGPSGLWATTIGGVVPIDPDGGPGEVVPATGVTVIGSGSHGPWVGTANGIAKLEPTTGRILASATLDAEPLAIVEAAGRVWVSVEDGTLRSFDAETLAADPVVAVGSTPHRIATNGDAVYVASMGPDGSVTRVDAGTRARTQRRIADPTDPGALGEIVATPAGVWVTRRQDLLRLDPTTLEVTSITPLPGYPLGIVVAGDTAWALAEAGDLDRAPAR